jgi:hypothetical protein
MIYTFFLYKILFCNGVKFIYSHKKLHSKKYLLFYLGFYEASCVTVSKAWTNPFKTCVITVPSCQYKFGFSWKLWSSPFMQWIFLRGNGFIVLFIVCTLRYFYILKHSLQNSPRWNNYLYLLFSASNNTRIIIRKGDFGCWLYAALSDVHRHEEFPVI